MKSMDRKNTRPGVTTDSIRERLAAINAYRASLPPEVRERIEREELQAQRESWVRAMAPCDHGIADFEECPDCRGDR